MSLQNLVNVAKCRDCPNMVPVGRLKPDKPRRCDQCKNRIRNEKHRLIKRLRALKKKRCHHCGGSVKRLGVFCSDYCRWLNHIRFTSHKKAIVSVSQIK